MWCGQLSFNWSLSSIRNYSSFDKIRSTPWLERKGGETQLAYWLSGGGNKRCIDARCLFSCNSQFVQLLSLFVLEQSRQVRPMTNAVPPLWCERAKNWIQEIKSAVLSLSVIWWEFHPTHGKRTKKIVFSRFSFPKMTLGADGTRRLDTH